MSRKKMSKEQVVIQIKEWNPKEVENRIEKLVSELKYPDLELGTSFVSIGRGGAGEAREIFLRSKKEHIYYCEAILHEKRVQITFLKSGFYKEIFLVFLSIILNQSLWSQEFEDASLIGMFHDLREEKINDEQIHSQMLELVQMKLRLMLEELENAKLKKKSG